MLRKPATTTPKQFQTTWCFGKDWRHAGGARDLQSATMFPRNPAIPLHLQKYCFLVSCAIFRKKGHCSNLIFGAVNTLAFWTPKNGRVSGRCRVHVAATCRFQVGKAIFPAYSPDIAQACVQSNGFQLCIPVRGED